MDRRHKAGVNPVDQKTLREREASLVSVADDARIIQLLADRAGTPTRAHLVDGQVLEVHSVGWVYDQGDPFAHVSTNVSPSAGDTRSFPFDFFFTDSVALVSDPANGAVLFRPESA